jgi:hypothetical protein
MPTPIKEIKAKLIVVYNHINLKQTLIPHIFPYQLKLFITTQANKQASVNQDLSHII